MAILLFVFGAALGSFINVIAVRHDPKCFILDTRVVGGRSRCPQCRATLRWFELVPLLSFLFQLARCRRCGYRISIQYPLVEITAGIICASVPLRLAALYGFLSFSAFVVVSALWVAVFLTLLLVVLIDKRLYIIPDEANIFLGLIGFLITAFIASHGGAEHGSFVGMYASLFGFLANAWINHILAAVIAGAIFALIIGITRGRGMGMGDLKLAIPLGLIFGWPDILLIIAFAFIIGAAYGVCAIIIGKKNLKSALPFGPFLAIAAAAVFFWGSGAIGAYMRLFGI